MLITGFAAGPLAANCYVAATGDGGECVVVDPGQRALEPLRDVLAEHRLRPAAVLVTHGHFDHVMCAAAVCAEYSVPVYLGSGDVPLLTGQLASLSPEFRANMTMLLGPDEDLTDLRPRELVMLGGGEQLRVAGLDIQVLAVPGHTPGSVCFRLVGGASGADGGAAGLVGAGRSAGPRDVDDATGLGGAGGSAGARGPDDATGIGGAGGSGGAQRPDDATGFAGAGGSAGAQGPDDAAGLGGDGEAASADVVFTGDTLFAGTIGRTDLPGGSSSLILRSIAAQLLSLPDETVVLPGHGEPTTIGAERARNPFLAGL